MNDLISLEEVNKWVDKLINELESIFSDIREKEVDDCVCGLCEYDCDHGLDGFANECPGFEKDDCFKLKDNIKEEWTEIKNVPVVPAIPIPENATNGDVIKALFPRIKIKKFPTFLRVIEGEEYIPMTYDWWNSPYKRGETE